MNFEERRQQKRRHLIKVAIAEFGMVCAVAAIVVVAILAAMGFFVSGNGGIEQSGLIQIHSLPTGASVELDGATIFSRTNLSRTMAAGEHNLKISRDGYDTWEKTIKMYSGMLIRLYYPRLFLENRTAEKVLTLQDTPMFYSVSGDNASILYANKDSAEWTLINIKSDDIKQTTLDLSAVLPTAEAKKYTGTVKIIDWNKDNDRVLIHATAGEEKEWILVNLKDVSKSLNLTKTFGMDFTQVEMLGGSAEQMLALENSHLRRINTANQEISRVLLDRTLEFTSYGTDVMYVTEETKDTEKVKQVGIYHDGDTGGTTVAILPHDTAVHIALTKYYDASYLVYTVDNTLTVRYGTIPSYREDVAEIVSESELKVLVADLLLEATPSKLSSSVDGEFIVGQNETTYMVLDLDMGDLYEYDSNTKTLNWLSDGIMYATEAGELRVWDFDQTNQRTLVSSTEADATAVTTISKYPVANYKATIASNNKWLYYLVQADKGLNLMREKIRD